MNGQDCQREVEPSQSGEVSAAPTTRERIIAAGLALLRQQGIADLSQAAIARLAGVRQSHVTYYFPHRAQLIAALAGAAVADMVAPTAARVPPATLDELAARIAAPEHMRMHLALMIEADRDPVVRAILNDAKQPMLESVGALIGSPAESARTHAALAALWGVGLYRFVAEPGLDDASMTAAAVAMLAGARRR